jgi:hypothetical protein
VRTRVDGFGEEGMLSVWCPSKRTFRTIIAIAGFLDRCLDEVVVLARGLVFGYSE